MPDRDADPGLSAKADGPFFILPDRQCQVLTLAAQGLTNLEIAQQLYLSPHTVPEYLRLIRERLGAANTTHAVAIAIVVGLIDVDAITAKAVVQGCPPVAGERVGGNES
jgi:DNA-binding NarL/FixJ family response regulator